MINSNSIRLSDALSLFLLTIKDERVEAQGDLNAFIRWCGRSRNLLSLTPSEVDNYASQVRQGVDSDRRLQRVKSFLLYLQKNGYIERNLASHVRAHKIQGQGARSRKGANSIVELTPDGLAQLKAEMEELKGRRGQIAEQIQRAAADKDFRENAPLEAAREQQGHMESRIRELEAILKDARVIEQRAVLKESAVRIGSEATIQDVATGAETLYILVDPSEANPAQGKLSVVSPVGKALLGHVKGEKVAVRTPSGELYYIILEIK